MDKAHRPVVILENDQHQQEPEDKTETLKLISEAVNDSVTNKEELVVTTQEAFDKLRQ